MNARIVAVAATAVIALQLCGCSDEESPTSSAPTSVQSPTPSHEAWRDDFSAEQLAAFDEASQFVDAFNAKWRPVLSAGKATPEAKRLLQEYRADWQAQWQALQVFAQREIMIPRAGEILWSKADSIRIGDGDEASVKIRRCTDSRDNGATEAGKPLNPPETPTEVVTTVDRDVDGKWLIYGTESAEKACAA